MPTPIRQAVTIGAPGQTEPFDVPVILEHVDRWSVVSTCDLEHVRDGRLLVWNAPRPLMGVERWQGEFHHGVFYAVTNANEGMFNRANVLLDAYLMRYLTDAEIVAGVNAEIELVIAEYSEGMTDLERAAFRQVGSDYWEHYRQVGGWPRLSSRAAR